MAEVVCNTSPMQYLHQIGLLDILPRLATRVYVPGAVREELAAGRAGGVEVPDVASLSWVVQRSPVSATALPLATDLGPGESQVLALAMEDRSLVAVLDDAHARRLAEAFGLRLTGTLGLLLDAKRAGLIARVSDAVQRLEAAHFRLAPATRMAVLRLAGEADDAR